MQDNDAGSSEEKQAIKDQTKNAQWIKKRRKTTYMIYVYALLLSTEYSSIVLTLYLYLKEIVKVDHVFFYYSIVMTSMNLSALATGLLAGRYIDRTRNIRKFVLVVLSITMLGNVLYTLHFSVWFLVVGRILCGFGEAVNSALSGELSRVYSSQDFLNVMYKFQSLYTIGFITGPALTVMFLKIDFTIVVWHINKYNFIGLFMAALLLVYNIFACCHVEDLTENTDDVATTDEAIHPAHSNDSRKGTLREILTSFPVMLVILSSSFVNYSTAVSELILPILAKNKFLWIIDRISVTVVVCVTLFVTIVFIIRSWLVEGLKRAYMSYIICHLILFVSLSLLMISAVRKLDTIVTQTAIFSLVTLLNSFAGLMSLAITKCLYLTLIPSHSASFYEGIRGVFYKVFGTMAFFSASLISPYLSYAAPTLMFGTFIFSVIFSVKWKYFIGILEERFDR